MSLITVALFMYIMMVEIQSKSDHMTPIRNRPRKFPRVLTTAKPTARIITTTNTIPEMLTINESAVTIPSTASYTTNFPTTEEPAIGILRFFDTSIRVRATKEPVFGIIQYSKTPKKQCLNLNEKCSDSKLSCCQTQKLDNGEIVNITAFCSIFDGQCESAVNFKDYNNGRPCTALSNQTIAHRTRSLPARTTYGIRDEPKPSKHEDIMEPQIDLDPQLKD